jgi:hypothetical protein
MKFEDFKKTGKVRSAQPDSQKIKSMKELTSQDLEYLETQEVTNISARKITTAYYDSLRTILEAIALKKGYKIYEHEAYKFFLKEINEESIAGKFDRFRKIRNSINYYAKSISPEETKEIVKDIKNLIKYLINKYLKE